MTFGKYLESVGNVLKGFFIPLIVNQRHSLVNDFFKSVLYLIVLLTFSIQLVRGYHPLDVFKRVDDIRLLVDPNGRKRLFEQLNHILLVVENLLVRMRHLDELLHKVSQEVQ